jgi:hypothetical protein
MISSELAIRIFDTQLYCIPTTEIRAFIPYSTVTDLARLRGWSTSSPRIAAI